MMVKKPDLNQLEGDLMEETKKATESRTVIAGVVGVAGIAAGFLGYTVGPEDTETLVAMATGIFAAATTIAQIIFRIKATKKIV
jgi:hypothetical protein